MGRGNSQRAGALASAGARRTSSRVVSDRLVRDQFSSIFGNRRGSSRGDDEDEVLSEGFELFLPSGKAGFGQSQKPPASALRRADAVLMDSGGSPESDGISELVDGWFVEVHTPGSPFTSDVSDDSEESQAAWDEFYDAFEKHTSDGTSCVFGAPEDGYFATVTPAQAA